MALTPEQQQLREQARERAAKLVHELEARAAELEKNPPNLEPKKLEEGRAAMRNAVAAVKRALENIEKAAEIADRR